MSAIWLLVRGEGRDCWPYEVPFGVHTIGRSIDCDIQIPHETISRRHAQFCNDAGTLFIRDLNSRNGTFVDNVRITESGVTVGIDLRLGCVKVEIVSDPNVDEAFSEEVFEEETASGAGTLLATREECQISGGLTASQSKVLKLLLQGMSEKMVASSLFISRQTVHTHIKEIYRQLNVHSRAELMALFISATVEAPPPANEDRPTFQDVWSRQIPRRVGQVRRSST